MTMTIDELNALERLPFDFLGAKRGTAYEIPLKYHGWFRDNAHLPGKVLQEQFDRIHGKLTPEQRRIIRDVQGAREAAQIADPLVRLEAEEHQSIHARGGGHEGAFKDWQVEFIDLFLKQDAPEHRPGRRAYRVMLADQYHAPQVDEAALVKAGKKAVFPAPTVESHIAALNRARELRDALPVLRDRAESLEREFEKLDQSLPAHNRERIEAHGKLFAARAALDATHDRLQLELTILRNAGASV